MALAPASSRGGFSGGTVAGATTFQPTADVTPLAIVAAAGHGSDVLDVTVGTDNIWYIDPNGTLHIVGRVGVDAPQLSIAASVGQTTNVVSLGQVSVTPAGILNAQGLVANPIASGALPTAAFVSATARQLATTRDVFCVVPFTGDATNNAATLKIELSPDNLTFSILDTLSIAAALNLTGAINVPVSFAVPAAWYVKLTATHGTIGTATYY